MAGFQLARHQVRHPDRGPRKMSTTITFLGTGTSVGVPVIGCSCPVCTSEDPRNRRMRSSIHIQSGELSLLIDCGPDFRWQALREDLRTLDAVLYTHRHADHVLGFDELRAYCWHRDSPLPIYAGRETIDSLERMFPWGFDPETHPNYTRVKAHLLDGPFTLDPVEITPLPVEHGGTETHGFRFDFPGGASFAYLSDVKRIPDETKELMQDLDGLALDALRLVDHRSHMTLAEALVTVEELCPRAAYLTHLTHDLEYTEISADLPEHVCLAVDQMKIRF